MSIIGKFLFCVSKFSNPLFTSVTYNGKHGFRLELTTFANSIRPQSIVVVFNCLFFPHHYNL